VSSEPPATAWCWPKRRPGFKDPYISQRCYGSIYRAKNLLERDPNNDTRHKLTWLQKHSLLPQFRNQGCRIRFEFDFPDFESTQKLLPYLSCAARYVSSGINYIPSNYDDAVADVSPTVISSKPYRDSLMGLISQYCPFPGIL
jgi:hypothetical protein